jgi:molybdate transport system regulatory protein
VLIRDPVSDTLVYMRLIYKIWLDNTGMAFGEGAYLLLKGIERTGSLLQAATSLEMAYTQARRIIASCERHLGFPLISRKTGGVSGGGSHLTPEAVGIMNKYEKVRALVEDALGETYRRHFNERVDVSFRRTVHHKRVKKPVR